MTLNPNDKLRFQKEWHSWAEACFLPGLTLALDEEQDINELVFGETAGHIAARTNNLTLFDFLRNHGADFSIFNDEHHNVLMTAAHYGSLQVAAKILSRGDPALKLNIQNSEGMNVLHIAAKAGHSSLVEFFLKKKYSPTHKIEPDHSQLNSHVEEPLTLIDLTTQDHLGNTALHYAIQSNRPLSVQHLLEFGADPSIENAKGIAPESLLKSKSFLTQTYKPFNTQTQKLFNF